MENNISLKQSKEFLKSKKFGELIRLEFFSDDEPRNNNNIFNDLTIRDIEDAMWLLDDKPQLVFAISGKINHDFDDFSTTLLEFKDSKTVIISSNWVTKNHKRNCNIVCTDGKVSLELKKMIEYENNSVDVIMDIANAKHVAEADIV